MPRATIDIQDTHKYDLKSLPGGFVVLRRLSYGEYLQRKEMMMQMRVQQQEKKGDAEMELSMANTKVATFEFKNCIVEHNLEDHAGALLDFRMAFTLTLLDPRVGEEIGDFIDDLHKAVDPDEATQGN